MRGTMMNFPLTLPAILERSGKLFHRVEIVSRRPDRSMVRTTYGDFYRRARRLADAITRLGLRPGDRVASMMWNHSGHLEAFFGVPCAGGILHTLNLRLHPHEIAAIINHAADRFLLIDDVLLPAFEKFRASVSFERVVVVPYCGGSLPIPEGSLNYEESWPTLATIFATPPSTKMTEPPCVTPPAPLATPKACFTLIAPWSCIPLPSWAWIPSPSATTIPSSPWPPCFTPTPGACPIPAPWPAPV
jgi:acyl-coenzyme A synthetase/AMP-(fatty) acid ligase